MSLSRQTFSVMDTHKLLEPFCMQINYNLDKWDFATWILSDMHVANLNVPCDSPVKCWLLCNNLSQITQWATILQFVIMCLYFYANKCTHYVPMKQRIQILFLYFMTKHYIFCAFRVTVGHHQKAIIHVKILLQQSPYVHCRGIYSNLPWYWESNPNMHGGKKTKDGRLQNKQTNDDDKLSL